MLYYPYNFRPIVSNGWNYHTINFGKDNDMFSLNQRIRREIKQSVIGIIEHGLTFAYSNSGQKR